MDSGAGACTAMSSVVAAEPIALVAMIVWRSDCDSSRGVPEITPVSSISKPSGSRGLTNQF